MSSLPPVHVVGTASALPNDPVDNERIESVLGQIGGRPSRARHRILKSNGIQTRHYAIDPETGEQTHTNAQLTAEAIRGLGSLEDVDCLACGTSSPDQLMPNHALMVQGELGIGPCEVVATAGTCLSGLTAFKYAVQSVATGSARSAVATGSELASSVMRASNFPQNEPTEAELDALPTLAFGQDFLRWMLSDGAGAVRLERDPAPSGLSLRVEWVDVVSYAHELEACMYWGAEKQPDGSLVGWRDAGCLAEANRRGMMILTQDARLLGREASHSTIVRGFAQVRERRPLEANDVDWLLPHYSSEFFRDVAHEAFREIDFEVPFERWFTNLTSKGNTGSASIFIMLDELLRSGRVEEGQKILCYVPESARFSVGYALLTAVRGDG